MREMLWRLSRSRKNSMTRLTSFERPEWYSVGVSFAVSYLVPPQLRMFMRMTLQPALQNLLALPMTYCDSEEPSRPWRMSTVGRAERTAEGCQRHSQRTWLEIWVPRAAQTSTSSTTGAGRWFGRGRKFPAIVCRWPFESHRRG